MSRYRLDTHVIARLATSLLIVAGLLIAPTGCFLVPADSDAQLGSGTTTTGGGSNTTGNDPNDSSRTEPTAGEVGPAGPAGPQGAQGEQGIQGVPGVDGVNCWDANGNGQNDAEEDTNADGVFDALDCQGATGPTGSAGTNGQDGEDLTGVLARAVIPPDGNFGNVTGHGVVHTERTATGKYSIDISLADFPDAFRPVTNEDLTVLTAVESQPQSAGSNLLSLLFSFYEITSIDEGTDVARIEVTILQLTQEARDATFSIVVLGP